MNPDQANRPNVEQRTSETPVGYFVPFHSEEGSEIDLLEIWRILWRRRWLMISVPLILAVLAVIYALSLPNIYRGDVLLAPVTMEDAGRNVMGDLGGLASLAGLSVSSGGDTDENLAILQSREFVWRFIETRKLMPILFADDWDAENESWSESDEENQPTLWDAYRQFKDDMLNVSIDQNTGLVNISIDWTDATLASIWANDLIGLLNEHLRARAIERSERNLDYLNQELERSQVAEMRETLYQLIAKEQRTKMLANTQPEYAFQVVDPAVIPDRKIKPKRSIFVLLIGFAGGILVALYVLIAHAVSSRSYQQSAA